MDRCQLCNEWFEARFLERHVREDHGHVCRVRFVHRVAVAEGLVLGRVFVTWCRGCGRVEVDRRPWPPFLCRELVMADLN